MIASREITDVAAITILPLKMEDTYTDSSWPGSVGATVIEASKGRVGEVTAVTAATLKQYFGNKPFPKSSGTRREGYMQLNDALSNGASWVNVVRVVADDALFPTVSLTDTPAIVADTEAYGTEIVLASGTVMTIYPIDGDPSLNRSVEISEVPVTVTTWTTGTAYTVGDIVKVSPETARFYSYGEWNWYLKCIKNHTAGSTLEADRIAGNWEWEYGTPENRMKITFYDKDDFGREYTLEEFICGIDPADRGDDGRSAYVETMLDEQSSYFRAKFDDTVTWADMKTYFTTFVKTAFTGGTNGGDPTTQDYKDAWDVFKNETIEADLLFAAGCYDPDVIKYAASIAEERNAIFFFDVPPQVSYAEGVARLLDMAMETRHAAAYHCPFRANDQWYDGKAVWGCSGDIVAACARGNRNMTGAVPGVHFAPAGMKRAVLSRTGIEPLFPKVPLDMAMRQTFVKARLNPVIVGGSGGYAFVDDELTTFYENNYGRFIHVNRIAMYVDRFFFEMAASIKFEPDGFTYNRLSDGMKRLFESLVASGALVKPRDKTKGSAPFAYTVTQVEIDLWRVDYEYCPTGVARRIAGQPKLIR